MPKVDENLTGKPKRGPGRPRGYPKSGGRKPGTCNKDRAATIEKIMREADPLLFLCKVARGDRMSAAGEPGESKKTWWIPTGDQRISAAQTLARKVLPDMKAVEFSGDAPMISRIIRQIVDPLSSTSEAPANSLVGNGMDKDAPPDARDLADRCTVDVITKRRRL